MQGSFADHYSRVAAEYATYRPRYPDALFDYLGELAPARDLAWDCAAGSGQATLALTAHFGRVVASDASESQIRAAPSHPRVEYRVATAEASGLPSASVDLIAVAQAVHWFDFERFHAEVRWVAVPRGIVAVWCYGVYRLDHPGIDRALGHFYSDVVGPYWPRERRFVEEGYATIPFPFDELTPPVFEMTEEWTLARLLGYLRTWSSTSRYREARGEDPVVALGEELAALWGDAAATRRVRWPLAMRVGRVG